MCLRVFGFVYVCFNFHFHCNSFGFVGVINNSVSLGQMANLKSPTHINKLQAQIRKQRSIYSIYKCMCACSDLLISLRKYVWLYVYMSLQKTKEIYNFRNIALCFRSSRPLPLTVSVSVVVYWLRLHKRQQNSTSLVFDIFT